MLGAHESAKQTAYNLAAGSTLEIYGFWNPVRLLSESCVAGSYQATSHLLRILLFRHAEESSDMRMTCRCPFPRQNMTAIAPHMLIKRQYTVCNLVTHERIALGFASADSIFFWAVFTTGWRHLERKCVLNSMLNHGGHANSLFRGQQELIQTNRGAFFPF